jgi:hypothetical protein
MTYPKKERVLKCASRLTAQVPVRAGNAKERGTPKQRALKH